MTQNQTEAHGEPMKDVSHTDPNAASSLRQLYARGRTVAADGGRAGVRDESETETNDEMRAVDHTPPDDTEPNRVFERGGEFQDE